MPAVPADRRGIPRLATGNRKLWSGRPARDPGPAIPPVRPAFNLHWQIRYLSPDIGRENGMAREREVERRLFLKTAALGAGALPFAPQLITPAAATETNPRPTARGQTTTLARYATAVKYEDLPPAVVRRVKDCITDTVAAILYGEKLPWSRIIIAHAQHAGPGGKSHIL